MIYARIKNGIVRDRIIIDNENLIDTFSDGYDYIIRVDNMNDQPQIGWLYDGNSFTPAELDI